MTGSCKLALDSLQVAGVECCWLGLVFEESAVANVIETRHSQEHFDVVMDTHIAVEVVVCASVLVVVTADAAKVLICTSNHCVLSCCKICHMTPEFASPVAFCILAFGSAPDDVLDSLRNSQPSGAIAAAAASSEHA